MIWKLSSRGNAWGMAMNSDDMKEQRTSRTAGEAGWHVSRYNLSAPLPGSKNTAVANLFKGTCAEYSPLEMYLLSVVEDLDENHPIIQRFAKRGLICNYDELAALETMGRGACAAPRGVGFVICPTMGCNFNCPYCFENHHGGKMTAEVQDDVMGLAERMLDASGAKNMKVTWLGGEPLVAFDVVQSLSERFIALCEERGVEYSARIITNGYLLTQDIVDKLAELKVNNAQVTIDGLGAAHDATRHLVNGGPTFERIAANLRNLKIPFSVSVRHNVHAHNKKDMDDVSAFVKELAEESGNTLIYWPAIVIGSEAADGRGDHVDLLCSTDASEVGIRVEARRFQAGHGHHCGAQNLWGAGIDEKGNLQMCWEAVDKPQYSFGTAHDWDPANPIETASAPDNLTMYLNTALPVRDDECRACKWLPLCAGGCPHRRLFYGRDCVAFKDDPEGYVLALHARMNEEKRGA